MYKILFGMHVVYVMCHVGSTENEGMIIELQER